MAAMNFETLSITILQSERVHIGIKALELMNIVYYCYYLTIRRPTNISLR